MLQTLRRDSVVVSFAFDPAANKAMPLWRAPKACIIKRATVSSAFTLAAATANYFTVNLLNGGTAGTATTAIGGTAGGTAGWTALTEKTLITSDTSLAAGAWVVANYVEAGTGTFQQMTIQVDYEF